MNFIREDPHENYETETLRKYKTKIRQLKNEN